MLNLSLQARDTDRGPKNTIPHSFNTLRTSEKRTTSLQGTKQLIYIEGNIQSKLECIANAAKIESSPTLLIQTRNIIVLYIHSFLSPDNWQLNFQNLSTSSSLVAGA